ncbi:MAG: hypothetical protein IPH44_24045 [Myxococcales bacterium]|nr:hypothetical protein [Myxococcales bacterium]
MAAGPRRSRHEALRHPPPPRSSAGSVVAAERGVAFDLINTAHDDGTAALKAVSPIWKVPVAEVGGRVLFDSRG